MDKNIAIIHYNTPRLTECLVRSINMHMSDAKITIFDNSTTLPFTYKCDNLTVIDNTKGQVINFDNFIRKYPKRHKSNGRTNDFGSAKHCYTVQKLVDMFDDGFILLDSDTLVKKDLSDLFDESCIYVATVETQPRSTIKRVLPFLCYINAKMCKRAGVRYFDENYMHGLMFNKNNRASDSYDTGSGFYLKVEQAKCKHREIRYDDYIVHYGHGSWKKRGVERIFNPREWLYVNRQYWLAKNHKVVYTCITNGYDTIRDPKYITMDYDYVCFTDDKNMKSDIWDIRPLPKECEGVPSNKKQRLVKILPHLTLGEYDLSIWVDGNMEICGDLDEFVRENAYDQNCTTFIPLHPKRDCIYDEEKAVLSLKKDVSAITGKQMKKYREEGYPEHAGLVQSNMIVRRHNDKKCISLMRLWYDELKNNSHRDQLSFNYALWKLHSNDVKYLDKDICKSKWFRWNVIHGKSRVDKKVVGKQNTQSNRGSKSMSDKSARKRTQNNKRKRMSQWSFWA